MKGIGYFVVFVSASENILKEIVWADTLYSLSSPSKIKISSGGFHDEGLRGELGGGVE
jgi:hypothetical protein